jgi:hypothetical protein
MKPLAPLAPNLEKKSPGSKKAAGEATKPAIIKRVGKKLRKTGRGAEMSEDFE